MLSFLQLPYIFNIVVLVPVAFMTLLGGWPAARRVFQDKFVESEGIRTILGSLWTAILICSVVGIFFPVTMAPLLLVQVIYKSLWMVAFCVPRWLSGRGNEIPSGIAGTFLTIIATYPWTIPWTALFAG